MQLSFVKLKSTVRVELRDAKGNLKIRASSKFASEKDFLLAAEQLEVDAVILRYAIDAFERGGPAVIDLGKRQRAVHMRPIRSPASESVAFNGDSAVAAFTAALDKTDADMEEPCIYWDNCDELAALDLDAAPGYEYDDAKLLTLDSIPTPAFAWATKSGGLRLIYHAENDFTAEEVAAIAYLCLMKTPHTGLEIKHDTRHPAYDASDGSHCGQVFRRQQYFDPHFLRRWLNLYSVDDAEVQEYLASRGMVPGVHYEHSYCPVDPGHVSKTKPVNALEKGIHCFSCEARGLSAGSSRPGFFPYSYLCGAAVTSILYRCMENAVHWEHAKFIIESKLQLTGRYASLIYSAGMRLHGFERKLIDRVFTAGRNFIRMGDRWTNLNGETYSKDIKPMLGSLPVCCSGPRLTPNRPMITVFEQSFDLSRYGYPSIKPVYGAHIWGHYLEHKDITAVIQTREYSDDSMVRYRPRHLTKLTSDYWRVIEQAFPGINKNYLKLLVAARGLTEGGASMPPFIFVTGPSGAGKSLSVHLAASICGDENTEAIWTVNVEKVRQTIMDARGAFVTFNEATKSQTESLSALDFLLNLTPDSYSHYMYLGPMRLGPLPVIVLSDTEIAMRVKQDVQLARRITHAPIEGSNDWETSLMRIGVAHPKDFRKSSEQAAEACNCVFTEVIEEFFRDQATFHSIARRLGFRQLSESIEAEESRAKLLALFLAVCDNQADANGFVQGRGWCDVRQEINTPVQQAWLNICENEFTSSRRCSEQDWRKLVGAKETIVFDLRTHGNNRIAIRFRSVDGQRVNKELL